VLKLAMPSNSLEGWKDGLVFRDWHLGHVWLASLPFKVTQVKV
jgi:hypothetical protein